LLSLQLKATFVNGYLLVCAAERDIADYYATEESNTTIGEADRLCFSLIGCRIYQNVFRRFTHEPLRGGIWFYDESEQQRNTAGYETCIKPQKTIRIFFGILFSLRADIVGSFRFGEYWRYEQDQRNQEYYEFLCHDMLPNVKTAIILLG
jgi:hypothetical protein